MPHLGTLHDYIFDRNIDDIRGTTLFGINDEKLGKLDDVIFDHATGEIKYAVVDTGGWFTHRKFLVPADQIQPYGKDEKAFQINLDKQRVESTFPKFDENILKSDPEWEAYETEYKRLWQQDPSCTRPTALIWISLRPKLRVKSQAAFRAARLCRSVRSEKRSTNMRPKYRRQIPTISLPQP